MVRNSWIPRWCGIPYAILSSRFGYGKFSFSEAKDEIGLSEATLLKILSELNKRGFLVSTIGEKRYQLSDFKSLCDGIKANRDCRGLGIDEKLRKASEEYKKRYMITGSYAAFFYHEYQFPVLHEVKVFLEDYGFWKNFLSVELKPGLSEEEFKDAILIDDLFIEPPEKVIVGRIKESSVTSTLDLLAILVSEKGQRYIDWKRLKEEAINHGVINELGAVLEILEKEMGGRDISYPIDRTILNELFTHIITKGNIKVYPKNVLKREETYKEIAKKWRLRLDLPRYLIKKVFRDIVPLHKGVLDG